MLVRFKKNWKEFKASRPGHRFQERCERRQKQAGPGFNWKRFANVAGGIVLTLLGLFLLPAPGPGSIVVVAGLALLGSEFLFLARFLDWSEVKGRRLLKWAVKKWRTLSRPARISLMAAACLMAAGLAWAGFLLLVKH